MEAYQQVEKIIREVFGNPDQFLSRKTGSLDAKEFPKPRKVKAYKWDYGLESVYWLDADGEVVRHAIMNPEEVNKMTPHNVGPYLRELNPLTAAQVYRLAKTIYQLKGVQWNEALNAALKKFDETKHRRDKEGKFAKKEGGVDSRKLFPRIDTEQTRLGPDLKLRSYTEGKWSPSMNLRLSDAVRIGGDNEPHIDDLLDRFDSGERTDVRIESGHYNTDRIEDVASAWNRLDKSIRESIDFLRIDNAADGLAGVMMQMGIKDNLGMAINPSKFIQSREMWTDYSTYENAVVDSLAHEGGHVRFIKAPDEVQLSYYDDMIDLPPLTTYTESFKEDLPIYYDPESRERMQADIDMHEHNHEEVLKQARGMGIDGFDKMWDTTKNSQRRLNKAKRTKEQAYIDNVMFYANETVAELHRLRAMGDRGIHTLDQDAYLEHKRVFEKHFGPMKPVLANPPKSDPTGLDPKKKPGRQTTLTAASKLRIQRIQIGENVDSVYYMDGRKVLRHALELHKKSLNARKYDESKHRRDKDGQYATKGGNAIARDDGFDKIRRGNYTEIYQQAVDHISKNGVDEEYFDKFTTDSPLMPKNDTPYGESWEFKAKEKYPDLEKVQKEATKTGDYTESDRMEMEALLEFGNEAELKWMAAATAMADAYNDHMEDKLARNTLVHRAMTGDELLEFAKDFTLKQTLVSTGIEEYMTGSQEYDGETPPKTPIPSNWEHMNRRSLAYTFDAEHEYATSGSVRVTYDPRKMPIQPLKAQPHGRQLRTMYGGTDPDWGSMVQQELRVDVTESVQLGPEDVREITFGSRAGSVLGEIDNLKKAFPNAVFKYRGGKAAVLSARAYDETKHRRDADGQYATKDGGSNDVPVDITVPKSEGDIPFAYHRLKKKTLEDIINWKSMQHHGEESKHTIDAGGNFVPDPNTGPFERDKYAIMDPYGNVSFIRAGENVNDAIVKHYEESIFPTDVMAKPNSIRRDDWKVLNDKQKAQVRLAVWKYDEKDVGFGVKLFVRSMKEKIEAIKKKNIAKMQKSFDTSHATITIEKDTPYETIAKVHNAWNAIPFERRGFVKNLHIKHMEQKNPFDGGVVAGNWNRHTGTISLDIGGLKYNDQDTIKRIIEHEAGHSVFSNWSKEQKEWFTKEVRKIKPMNEYTKNWLALVGEKEDINKTRQFLTDYVNAHWLADRNEPSAIREIQKMKPKVFKFLEENDMLGFKDPERIRAVWEKQVSQKQSQRWSDESYATEMLAGYLEFTHEKGGRYKDHDKESMQKVKKLLEDMEAKFGKVTPDRPTGEPKKVLYEGLSASIYHAGGILDGGTPAEREGRYRHSPHQTGSREGQEIQLSAPLMYRTAQVLYQLQGRKYDESKHRRDDAGKYAKKDGGGSGENVNKISPLDRKWSQFSLEEIGIEEQMSRPIVLGKKDGEYVRRNTKHTLDENGNFVPDARPLPDLDEDYSDRMNPWYEVITPLGEPMEINAGDNMKEKLIERYGDITGKVVPDNFRPLFLEEEDWDQLTNKQKKDMVAAMWKYGWRQVSNTWDQLIRHHFIEHHHGIARGKDQKIVEKWKSQFKPGDIRKQVAKTHAKSIAPHREYLSKEDMGKIAKKEKAFRKRFKAELKQYEGKPLSDILIDGHGGELAKHIRDHAIAGRFFSHDSSPRLRAAYDWFRDNVNVTKADLKKFGLGDGKGDRNKTYLKWMEDSYNDSMRRDEIGEEGAKLLYGMWDHIVNKTPALKNRMLESEAIVNFINEKHREEFETTDMFTRATSYKEVENILEGFDSDRTFGSTEHGSYEYTATSLSAELGPVWISDAPEGNVVVGYDADRLRMDGAELVPYTVKPQRAAVSTNIRSGNKEDLKAPMSSTFFKEAEVRILDDIPYFGEHGSSKIKKLTFFVGSDVDFDDSSVEYAKKEKQLRKQFKRLADDVEVIVANYDLEEELKMHPYNAMDISKSDAIKAQALLYQLKARKYDESKHRRDEDGQYAEKEGGGSDSKKFEAKWKEKYAEKWDDIISDDASMHMELKGENDLSDAYMAIDEIMASDWVEKNIDDVNKILGTNYVLDDEKFLVRAMTLEQRKDVAEWMTNAIPDEEFKPEDFEDRANAKEIFNNNQDLDYPYEIRKILGEFAWKIGMLTKVEHDIRDALITNPEKFSGVVDVSLQLGQQAEIDAIIKKRWDNATSFYRGTDRSELDNLQGYGYLGWGKNDGADKSYTSTSINKITAMTFASGVILEFPKDKYKEHANPVNYNVFTTNEYHHTNTHNAKFLHEEEYYFEDDDKIRIHPKDLKIHMRSWLIEEMGGIEKARELYKDVGEVIEDERRWEDEEK